MKNVCDNSPCFEGVACTVRGLGSFSCGNCPEGYYGDGIVCKGTILLVISISLFHPFHCISRARIGRPCLIDHILQGLHYFSFDSIFFSVIVH